MERKEVMKMPCKWTRPKRAEARRPDTGAPKAEEPKADKPQGEKTKGKPKGKGKKEAK